MLDNIISQLKDKVGGELQRKENVDSGQVDGIMDVVKNVAMEKVGKEMLGGGLENVMNLFGKKENHTGGDKLQSEISTGIMGGLMEKLGFDKGKAGSIVTMILPLLMKFITDKNSETADDDASPLKDLFGGGVKGGIGGAAGKALGGLFK